MIVIVEKSDHNILQKINFIKKGESLVEVKRSEKVKKLKKKEGVKEEVASKRKEYQEYKREECQQ